MICFGSYYHFSGEDVEYISLTNVGGEYPYKLMVFLRSGRCFSVSYKIQKDAEKERDRLVHSVDTARNAQSQRVFIKLQLLDYSIRTIDRRQLRIWRQLRDLLNLKIEEVSTNV